MRRVLRVAALMFPLALASSVLAWGEQPPVEAEPLTLIPAPALEMATRSLADEIFKVGQPEANTVAAGYWGRCTQSCAPCWSLTGCPPDDDGTPQYCWRYCP